MGNEFKAIDYEDAGLNDPYFDLASAAIATAFYSTPAHEKVLFATYLGRQPTAVEDAKLYLMKQIVFIKRACDALNRATPEDVHRYGLIEEPSHKDLARELFEGNLDLSKSENNLKYLKTLLNYVIENSESKEFQDSVSLLNDKNLS